MNYIYVICHEVFSYEDNDTTVDVELFEDFNSAQLYYAMLKENIITEYENYRGETIDILQQNEEEFYMHETNDFNQHNPKGNKKMFYINLDEYGSDTLFIKEKAPLKLNI